MFMKPNHENHRLISAPEAHQQSRLPKCVLPFVPLLKHLNMPTLAVMMFVAATIVGTAHGGSRKGDQQAFTATAANGSIEHLCGESSSIAAGSDEEGRDRFSL
jgi:hypothetical protein